MWLKGVCSFMVFLVSLARGYRQTGSCFEDYRLRVTSCSDVSEVCSSSICSLTSSGDIAFTCYVPYECSGISRLYFGESRLLADAYYGYDQTGSCFADHNIEVASCSDVHRLCTSYSCSKNDSRIMFDCHTPSFSCSGVAAVPSTRAVSSTPRIGDCRADHGLLLTTCADVSLVNLTDCTCFACEESKGRVQFSCSAPFSCINEFPSNAIEEAQSRQLTQLDFCLVALIYITCIGVFAFALWVLRPNQRIDPSKPPLTFFQEAVVVFNPSTAILVLAESALNGVWYLIIEPNQRKDGSPTTLIEFAVSSNPWIGLFYSCSRSQTHLGSRDQHKRPFSKRQALSSLAFETSIVVSLAFLLGTALNNAEMCDNVIVHSYCSHSGERNVTAAESVSGCKTLELTTMSREVLFIVTLTKAVSFIADYALSRLKDKRKLRFVSGRNFPAAVLLVFGIGYSFKLAVTDYYLSARRYTTVGMLLAMAWVLDQASAVSFLLVRRVGVVYVWLMRKRRDGEQRDEPRGAVVLPTVDENHVEDQPVTVFSNVPTAPDFTMMLSETEF